MHYEWVQPMDRPPLELATYDLPRTKFQNPLRYTPRLAV